MKRIRLEVLTSAQTLLIGYLLFIILGASLLTLPVSVSGNERLSFIDSLFTAASSISGSGLIVVDTGSYFSLFGQLVILFLIQTGNIGYMMIFALAVLVFGGKLSLVNKMLIKNSISISNLDIRIFVFKVFKYTLIIEGISALLLFLHFIGEFHLSEAIYQSVFHSISSFCTAGFSLFPDNLSAYSDNHYIVFVVILTSYLGSCGFFVLHDLSGYVKSFTKKKRLYKLSTHTKIAVSVSLIIIVSGTVFIWLAESILNPNHVDNTFLTAFFQSASASTTVGYNTINIGDMNNSSQLILIIEMFIGASPSGTGGGIKTTVFTIMVLALFSFIRDRKNVNTLHRSVHPTTIAKAFSISFLALMLVIFSVLVLSLTESADFLSILFEVVSAFGGVGLSAGITQELSSPGKFLLSIVMLVARTGPLLVGYSLIGKTKAINYQYPEANILIV
ncbi:MAG: hypothetical protein OZ913_00175 [Ignavibacteriaceae bacterium]|nr:MAG: Trk family potassium uptake protein [Chlorobiota bacterium]KXK04959.1 MAG: H(+)-transporting two-sector ATPase [Chlorobi bacterium OLB4]MBV6397774.1 Ktr system potassium uptake protein B [Ignavibacteria bacterium]MCC6885551.1 hypothetical protein [Ignavibacteriales bacterium]MCE7952905.1 Trk family potassium uptake protein [Chlorobi bacterium CHB7]MDL1886931.1 Trk family potassium uptake protein [Ignavibacteria bacterium CHB1]MEB2328701.1 hypothetical protein [Ignavibacteriaceae bacte